MESVMRPLPSFSNQVSKMVASSGKITPIFCLPLVDEFSVSARTFTAASSAQFAIARQRCARKYTHDTGECVSSRR
jgi:hypothetical protein